jgi:hypothetical protein
MPDAPETTSRKRHEEEAQGLIVARRSLTSTSRAAGFSTSADGQLPAPQLRSRSAGTTRRKV